MFCVNTSRIKKNKKSKLEKIKFQNRYVLIPPAKDVNWHIYGNTELDKEKDAELLYYSTPCNVDKADSNNLMRYMNVETALNVLIDSSNGFKTKFEQVLDNKFS